MKMLLDEDGSVELSRSERIVRGQNGSKIIEVAWKDGCSPVERNLVLQDNLAVRVCITRPDGEQSGWQIMHKIDNEVAYYYPLQLWDTIVAGEAKVSVQWYDCSDEAVEEYGDIGRVINTSQQGGFIIDNSVIAQPMGTTNEKYDQILQALKPVESQAFRKHDANDIPSEIDYQPNGKKNAPALYYNAPMTIKQYDGETNTYKDVAVKGNLIVSKVQDGENVCQSEMLIVGEKIYLRKLIIANYTSDTPSVVNADEAEAQFYDISTSIKDYVIYQIKTYGYSKTEVDNLLSKLQQTVETSVATTIKTYKDYFDKQTENTIKSFNETFVKLDERLKMVEEDWFKRLDGENISEADLINLVTNCEDGFFVVNTEQFGDEFIFVQQDGKAIARYTATGESYKLDFDIMDWELSAGGGSGGGGGGGSSLRLTALTALELTTAVGAETLLAYNFKSSMAGKGTAKYYVDDILKSTKTINQGNNSFDATQYVISGSTQVKIVVTDSAGSSATLEYIVNGVELKLSSTFDDAQAYTGDIDFRFVISGETSKEVHFVLDGTELETMTTDSTRQQSFTIPSLSHGLHTFTVYAIAELNGDYLTSNELNYNIIAYEDGATDVIIASKFDTTEATQGEIVAVDYIVYDPSNTLATVKLEINDEEYQTLSIDRTKQYWYLRDLTVGNNTLKISCGEQSISFDISILEADFDVEAVTENLELYLSAQGRSNSEANKDVWQYGDIKAEFTNLNWSTNGWLSDENNSTFLRLNGEAKVYIPFKPFATDFRSYGKTIEFEFATRDVATIDTIAIVSYSGNIGVRLKMNEALIQSEQSVVTTKYKDEERIRVSFVIDDKNGLRLIRTFVNGVLSGLAQYPANDNFAQSSPVGITINPDGGSMDIYKIRIYDTALSDVDMLNNYIADRDELAERLEVYNENNIYDTNGKVSYAKVKGKIPTVVITGTLPAVKGDKKACVVTYENPLNISRNFEHNATVDIQGTSSQGYPRKNWKIKLPNEIDFFGNGLKEDTFTIKVNYMESGNRNNTGIANFVHGENGQIYDEKVPPQETNEAIRTVIKGEPIVLFHKANASSTPTFYAIGHFNNDKGNANTLGLTSEYPNAESWEFKDNDELLCLFKTNDFSRNENAFEARYPDKNTNFTQIDALVEWVYSTMNDVDKFKAEFEQHFNLHYTLMYYIITETFGMVDSRAKNMFLNTWDGQIWYPVLYDMDTSFGLNNEGVNSFNYNIEYNDQIGSQNVFNGQSSVLWNNFEEAYADEIKALYTSLRSNGKLTYDAVLNALDAVTRDFSKALYNVDAGNKYIGPLEEDGDATYLYCAQGDRREHLKWWLANRFKYLDSKYYAKDYADDFVSMRIYSPSDTTTTSAVPFNGAFTLTSFIAQYLGVKYGASGTLYQVRTEAETATKVSATSGTDLNDKETYVYGASNIKDLGDLSSKYVGTLDVSKATKLSKLIVGNSKTNYSNTNLTSLKIGNNKLLKYLDVRNCPNLAEALDLSGCENIQEIYATGTSIPSVTLAKGGNLRKITLPATITNLTLKNQPLIETITMAGYSNVATLVVESCNSVVDTLVSNIVQTSTVLARVRLINVDWKLADCSIFTTLMACGGMDESDNTTEKSIITGKVHFDAIGQNDINKIKAYYPNLTVTYTTLIEEFTVTFVDDDGVTVLDTQFVTKGSSAVDPTTRELNPIAIPIKPADAQYTYTFAGWNGTLNNVYANRTVVAKYTSTINSYTVNFYNNSSGTAELLYTQTVDYGSPAKFVGNTPTYQGSASGTWLFGGWSPSVANITGHTDAYATFSEMKVPDAVKPLAQCTPAEIVAIGMNGTKNASNQWVVGDDVWFEIGDETVMNLNNGIALTIAIGDFNHDVDSTGAIIPFTFIAKELLPDSKAMNASSTNAGGWPNSAMYTYVQGTVWEWIPDEWKVLIIPALKSTTEGSKSTAIIQSVDNLFLLSLSEVDSSYKTQTPYSEEGTTYPIFTNATSRKKCKVGTTSASIWWLRSPHASDTSYFWYVNSSGSTSGTGAIGTYGVCFAFCMGKS